MVSINITLIIPSILTKNNFVKISPQEHGQLKRNYNSIDLTEVEQFDDGVEGREPGDQLLEVRAHAFQNTCSNFKTNHSND